jgi:non-ribosomal peptide synthase protein (TIGR01720 family)
MRTESEKIHRSLNLGEGPLLRAAYFELGAGKPDWLLLVAHHLVVDPASWRILLEDLLRGYDQLALGKMVELPAKTTSYKHWAERLASHANSEALAQEASYWLSPERSEVRPLPLDEPQGSNTVESERAVVLDLSTEETQALLQDVPAAFQTQINEVILAALGLTLARWSGSRHALIELEGHGREEVFDDVDLTRTVGWFTTLYPALLKFEEAGGALEALASVKESLRELPNRGIGYGLLRYMSDGGTMTAKFGELPQPEVLFNYIGQFSNSTSEHAFERVLGGLSTSQLGNRSHLFVVEGSLREKRLFLTISYSQNMHSQSTVMNLANRLKDVLRQIIHYCQTQRGDTKKFL